MKLNEIYNENCLVTMSKMPNKFVDLSLTSPPYNMNLRIRNGKYCSRQIVKEEFSTKYDNFADNIPIDQFYEFHKNVMSELIRVSRIVFYNIQIVTGSKRAFFKIIGDFNENLKDVIIWDKCNGQPAMKDRVFNRQSELILIFEDKENAISRQFDIAEFGRGTESDVWRIRRGKKQSKDHGAVFPEEFANKVISIFSKEDGVVYDPFMGTGTTAKCALTNGRYFIGSEISEKYCKTAKDRIRPFLPETK